MKTSVCIILSLLLAVLLAFRFAPIMANTFLQDALSVYGSRMTASTLNVDHTTIDWNNKTTTFSRIDIRTTATKNVLADIDTMEATLPAEFQPTLSQPSLLPNVIPVRKLVLNGVTLSFNIDEEGNSLRTLRQAISADANTQSRQRLNAAFNSSIAMPQRFIFEKITVKNIAINTVSKLNPTRQQTFTLPTIERLNIGSQEGGLSFAEAMDTVSQSIAENVWLEISSRGLLTPVRTSASPVDRPENRRAKRQNNRDQEPSTAPANSDGSVKKSFKGIGTAFGRFGRSIKDKLLGSD